MSGAAGSIATPLRAVSWLLLLLTVQFAASPACAATPYGAPRLARLDQQSAPRNPLPQTRFHAVAERLLDKAERLAAAGKPAAAIEIAERAERLAAAASRISGDAWNTRRRSPGQLIAELKPHVPLEPLFVGDDEAVREAPPIARRRTRSAFTSVLLAKRDDTASQRFDQKANWTSSNEAKSPDQPATPQTQPDDVTVVSADWEDPIESREPVAAHEGQSPDLDSMQPDFEMAAASSTHDLAEDELPPLEEANEVAAADAAAPAPLAEPAELPTATEGEFVLEASESQSASAEAPWIVVAREDGRKRPPLADTMAGGAHHHSQPSLLQTIGLQVVVTLATMAAVALLFISTNWSLQRLGLSRGIVFRLETPAAGTAVDDARADTLTEDPAEFDPSTIPFPFQAVGPTFAQRQLEEQARERERESAIMKLVFEQNLDLRQQLEGLIPEDN